MKDMNEFAAEITREEGFGVQVSVAQVKEILAIVARRVASEPSLTVMFLNYGKRVHRQMLQDQGLIPKKTRKNKK